MPAIHARSRLPGSALLALAIAFAGPPGPARADVTLVVNTTADTVAADGGCSLREAILAANADTVVSFDCFARRGGYDRIEFALGEGTPVIDVLSDLPVITGPVEIDGGPGRVELRGSNAGHDAIRFSGAATANSVVRRMVIGGFTVAIGLEDTTNVVLLGNYIGTSADGLAGNGNTNGVSLVRSSAIIGGGSGLTPGGPCTGDCNLVSTNVVNGVVASLGSSLVMRGNFVGTDVTGMEPLGNGTGISIGESSATIGGTLAGVSGNLVSGNETGIAIGPRPNDATGVLLQGNRIGTNSTGSAAVPNGTGILVRLQGFPTPVTIGGSEPGAGNLVSGNAGAGILLRESNAVAILGNRIGTAAVGEAPLPNGGAGIELVTFALGNVIGGIGAGEGNVIAFNAAGVSIGPGNYSNVVRGNSIHDNAGKGIALADSQGGTTAGPILYGGNPVMGSTCPYCTVDIYSDAADEGRTWEAAVQADDLGNFVFAGTAAGPYVSATTSHPPFNSTSEFVAAPYDRDADGNLDPFDNCTAVPNPSQLDADADGYGNACDGDLNNSGGLVNAADLALFRQAFGFAVPVADFNGSGGLVNAADLALFRAFYGRPPGPSGLVP